MKYSVKNLFVVDDDAEDYYLLRDAVHIINNQIVCDHAFDGETAFRQLQSSGVTVPDLILLAIDMPRWNGKKLLQEVRNNQCLLSVPVIMYSSCIDESEKQELLSLGATDCMTLPYSFQELASQMQQILSA